MAMPDPETSSVQPKPDLTSITSGKSAMSQAFQGLSGRPPLDSLDSWTPGATSDASDIDDRSRLQPLSKASNTDLRSSGTTAIPSDDSSQGDVDNDIANAKQEPTRRKSIQVVIEEEGKKSKYNFSTDDPEFREILRSSVQREAERKNGKYKNRPRDLVFTKQFTTFDRQNPTSQSPFHGFFTLFCQYRYYSTDWLADV